jgi:hypothetical protein
MYDLLEVNIPHHHVGGGRQPPERTSPYG